MSDRRGGPAGLRTPHPLGEMLPAPYLDDDLTQRWLSALDDVLAPVLLVIDGLDAYVDPRLTPPDVLDWLAGWVAVTTNASRPDEANRAWVLGAVRHHGRRGTALALRDELRQATGLDVEVDESGATTWSTVAGGPLPGQDEPALVVRVRAGDPAAVPLAAVERAVTAAKPAHVPHVIDVVPTA